MAEPVPWPVIAEKVSKDFGRLQALREVSFSVNSGEIFGLIGPNGSGKTTLIRLLLGLGSPTKGSLRVLGGIMPDRRVSLQIGYMTQASALYGDLSVRQNLSFFGRIYGIRGKALQDRTGETLALVDLSARIDSPVNSLSGGMRQRVSLAAALLHRPRVLFLDEPTVGIDPELRLSFWTYFERLAAEGVTILISTHYLDEARKCHRIALLRAGRVLAANTPAGLLRESGKAEFDEAFLYFATRREDSGD